MIPGYADYPTIPLSALPAHFAQQTTGPLRVQGILAAIEERKKLLADPIAPALSELFMKTMGYFMAHPYTPMPPQLVATLAAAHREAREVSASRWAILSLSIDIIAASDAARDPGVQKALDQARAARQPVL